MIKVVVPANELREGMQVAEPVLSNTGAHKNMIICRKGSILTGKIINLLKRHEVQKVEVYSDYANDQAPVASGFASNINSAQNEEANNKASHKLVPQIEPIIPPLFKERVLRSITNLFRTISLPSESVTLTTAHTHVQDFEKTLSYVVGAAASDPDDMIHIYDLKSHDEYTFHHSVSVGLLAVATGQSLGLELRELMSLGRSALFHDIGKQFVPSEIINKSGKLSKEEYLEIKSHPPLGATNIKAKGLGTTGVLSGILFHHEKIDGSGYPRGLKGNEIPLEAKIISIADVFDALTSYRSYRKPMTPTAAYETIMREVGTSFDYAIVEAFIKKMNFYPINTLLELSNKRIFIVVENQNALRPVVMDVLTKEKYDLSSSKNTNLTIERIASHEDLIERV